SSRSFTMLIIFLVHIIHRNNPLYLLEAYSEILRAAPGPVALVWVGAGPLRAELTALVRKLGLDGEVIFTGYVPEAEKVPTLNLADVFVFPSLLEGFPLAPQEAMSCGKPVVAFRVASLGEMVDDGKSGFLVARNDRSAFVERVLTLLRDRELLARFGAASAERVDRKFRWDMTVRRVPEVSRGVHGGLRA